MKRFLLWLLAIQVIGMFVAVAVAAAEIESILFSGSVLTVTGLLIAALSFRGDLEFGFYYGLAVLGVAVLCFSMIFGLQWGPSDAAVPIASLLFLSTLGSTPLGLLANWELRRSVFAKPSFRLQFNLSALFVLLTLLSIGFGLFLAAGSVGAACGVFLAYLIVVSCAAVRFHNRRWP